MDPYGEIASFGQMSYGAAPPAPDAAAPPPNTVSPEEEAANNAAAAQVLSPGAPAPAAASPGSALAPAQAAAPSYSAARLRAGTSIVVTGVGVGTGALLGGWWGAGSGLLLAGAASNVYMATRLWRSNTPGDRSEAMKRTVMAVIGLGAGGYLGYRAKKHHDGEE